MLFEEPQSSRKAKALSILILLSTLMSITTFILESMPELRGVVSPSVWLGFETGCTIIFTIEYVVRLFVCDVAGGTHRKFLTGWMNATDLGAILPFYVWLALRSLKWVKGIAVVKTVRLVRLFRIFKLGKYSSGLQLMMIALKRSSQALWVLLFFLFISIILFASAIYYVERIDCPAKDGLQAVSLSDGSNRTQWDLYLQECREHPLTALSQSFGICCDELGSALDFQSILSACWWAVVTMTGTGYGDTFPRTDLGRLVGVQVMLSGILLIALPIAIIGQKFQDVYDDYTEINGEAGRAENKNAKVLKRKVVGFDLGDLSLRLRLLRPNDPALLTLAHELANELDVAATSQKEIELLQAKENKTQLDTVNQFDAILSQLCTLCGSGDEEPNFEPSSPSCYAVTPRDTPRETPCGGLTKERTVSFDDGVNRFDAPSSSSSNRAPGAPSSWNCAPGAPPGG